MIKYEYRAFRSYELANIIFNNDVRNPKVVCKVDGSRWVIFGLTYDGVLLCDDTNRYFKERIEEDLITFLKDYEWVDLWYKKEDKVCGMVKEYIHTENKVSN